MTRPKSDVYEPSQKGAPCFICGLPDSLYAWCERPVCAKCHSDLTRPAFKAGPLLKLTKRVRDDLCKESLAPDETAALQGANWLIAFMAGMLFTSLLWAGALLLRAAGVL